MTMRHLSGADYGEMQNYCEGTVKYDMHLD